jgi:hypothetical protein
MHEVQVQCPYCYEIQWLEIESDERGEMVQDCEVCCRPWRVRVSWSRDHEPQAMVDRAQ